MTGPAWADRDDAPTWTTAKRPTNGVDPSWQPSPALRWRSWDAQRAEPGPWHVRHDRPDGSKAVTWQADDGTPGLGGHALVDLVYLAGGALPPAGAEVVVTEGEKAADAVAETGAWAVGTVCGASATPGPAVVASLARYAVTLSPDNDEPGRDHMGRIAAALERAGLARCRLIGPPDDAPKGWDLADPDPDERRALIEGAREIRGFGRPEPEPEPDLIVGIDAYRANVPTEIPWRCHLIAYSGGVTLIAGPPKAGKSTLAAQLQRCCETGEPFLGAWPVTVGPVLLVTEEGGVAVVYKTNGLHRLDILDRRAAAGLTFAQVLDAIGAWGAARPGGLVFVDTLAIWAGIENENDAGEATKAVASVTALAQSTELALALIHHARKSGGDNGEAIRGSGAILATVDIAVELSRVDAHSDDRWLDIQGRVIMPQRFLLTFDRLTQTYALGDRAESHLEEIEADLVGIPADGHGLTRNDLNGLWHKDPRKRAEQLLNVGRLRAEWVHEGRGWGWRYWSVPAAWTPPMRDSDG